MPTFTISVTNYQGSPVFDLHTSGHNISAVEIYPTRGVFGEKMVYVFETKDDAELQLTIKKLRGDVDIDLPQGWDIDTDTIAVNDFNTRLPRVCVAQEENAILLGYVATNSLKVHFFAQHQSLASMND